MPLRHFFLTSKPYSYSSEVSQALVFYLMGPHIGAVHLGAVAIQSLAMWLFFNWQSDRIQRDVGRTVPSGGLVAVPFCCSAAIGCLLSGWSGLAGVVAHTITVLLYSLKARHPVFGPLGPVLRGVTVCGQFVRVWSLSRFAETSGQAALVLGVLCLWSCSRNLVGDVRDVQTDIHELPARFGIGVTRWCLRLGMGLTLLLLLFSRSANRTTAITVVSLSWFCIEMLEQRFRGPEAHKWGYLGHRLLVLATVALQILLASPFGLPASWSVALIVIAMVFQRFYFFLPGKTFPTWQQVLAARE